MEKDQLFILDKWIKNYLNEKKTLNLSNNTLMNYKRVLDAFYQFFAQKEEDNESKSHFIHKYKLYRLHNQGIFFKFFYFIYDCVFLNSSCFTLSPLYGEGLFDLQEYPAFFILNLIVS